MSGNKRSVLWEELKTYNTKYPEDMTGWVLSEHGVQNSRWTVIKLDHTFQKKQGEYLMTYRYWECECSCDKHTRKIVGTRDLREGRSLSCGCAGTDKALKIHPNKKFNEYDLSGDYGIGYATNTHEPFYFDLEDYDKIKDYCWFVHEPVPGYKVLLGTKDKKHVKFHQLIGCKGFDHIDHNPLNNRRENLRSCTPHQNSFNVKRKKNNVTGITGVSEQKACPNKHWRARLMLDREEIRLGTFATFEEAVKARLEGEKKYFGEFAPQRHLFAQYGIEDIEEEEK